MILMQLKNDTNALEKKPLMAIIKCVKMNYELHLVRIIAFLLQIELNDDFLASSVELFLLIMRVHFSVFYVSKSWNRI